MPDIAYAACAPAVICITQTTDAGNDSIAGSYSWAIAQANAGGNKTIGFDTDVFNGANPTLTLSGTGVQTPRVTAGVTIDGSDVANLTIDGSNEREILFLRPDSPDPAAPIAVTIKGITLANGRAEGGAGGGGGYGGGGGMGAGGAIFVGKGVELTVENVTLAGNVAQGGAGGATGVNQAGSGGGGLNGGKGVSRSGGGGGVGGGGGGVNTNGGGTAGGAGATGATTTGANGDWGGGGGGGGTGTVRKNNTATPRGGTGGFGGGGGGGANDYLDRIYSPGGDGGFGGGAGGGYNNSPTNAAPNPAQPGFGGGKSEKTFVGGGGAGFGGAIFVEDGGSILLSGGGLVSGGAAKGVGTGIGASLGLGAGFYLQGTSALNVSVAAGQKQTISDAIDSDAYNDPTDPTNPDAAGDGRDGGVILSGAGLLELRGVNTYAGGTTVNGGTVNAAADNNLGHSSGGVALNNGTLQWGDAFDTARTFTLNGGGTIDTQAYDAKLTGVVRGSGGLTKLGSGTLTLTGVNTYTDGTRINAGTVSVAQNANLGAAAGALVFNGGTLRTTADIAMNRATTMDAGGGTFETASGTLLTQSGSISGIGHLTKTGTGRLMLLGDATHTGGTTISAGMLELGNGGTTGALAGNIINNAKLVFNRSNDLTMAGQISGTGAVNQIGSGTTTLTGDNSYTGGTTISAGILQIGDGGTTGSIAGDIINDATLVFNRSDSVIFDGMVSGSGAVHQAGPGSGTIILTGNNTYTGGTTITASILQLGDGGTTGSILGDVTNNGMFAFDRSDALTFDGVISGSGMVVQAGSGTTVLTGTNTYKDETRVFAGQLFVNGDQTAATGLTGVGPGATLGGFGIIGGNVQILDGGTLSPGEVGDAPGKLTINGDLSLGATATLSFNLGQANVAGDALNDLIEVGGNLALNGTLKVETSGGGTFGPGLYRIINYAGTLSGNFATVTVPSADFYVQTSIIHQVNLINKAGLALRYWDGTVAVGNRNDGIIAGGDGIWESRGNDNWTEETGTPNADWQDSQFAMFMGDAGTVTVDTDLGAVNVSGMQFVTDGYRIVGDTLTLVGAPSSTVRVGDGTLDGAATTATINAVVAGASELVKSDLGTLVLTGANTYTGGTAITGGVLQVSSSGNLGDTAGRLTLDGGTLRTTADIEMDRAVTLDSTGAMLTDAGTTLTLSGAKTGAGGLTKIGGGNLVFEGAASYTGDTIVRNGTLTAAGANVFSASSDHTVLAGARLDLAGFDQTIHGLDNAGTVRLQGALGTTLTVTGDYVGSNGLFLLGTVLEGDASATDRLVIDGDTSGTTTLAVTNFGGAGAPTTEGIKLVEVGGASDGTFSLAGTYLFEGEQAVVAGAYGYRLYQNGISTPSDGNWYLRSALLETTPLFQPGVPLYQSYANVLQNYNALGSLRQRVGNRSWAGNGGGVVEADETDDSREGNGIWGRIEAAHGRFDPKTATAETSYDVGIWKMQAGADALLHEETAGQWVGGVFADYGTISSDIRSVHGNGAIASTGLGVGATLTWRGAGGFYMDGQAKATWYDSDLTSKTAGRSLVDGNKAFGYAVSIEAGQTIFIDSTWSITPQAQLAYSAVNFDSFTDAFRASVSLDRGDSLKGRLGLSTNIQNDWKDASGQTARSNFYGIANLYYDFLEGSKTDISGTRLVSENDPFWGGVGVGGSYDWADDTYSIYGEASINSSLADFGKSYAVGGTVGMRVKW